MTYCVNISLITCLQKELPSKRGKFISLFSSVKRVSMNIPLYVSICVSRITC
jgi:hypothetical protein